VRSKADVSQTDRQHRTSNQKVENRECNRVLDLLEPGDLRLGQLSDKESCSSQARNEQWKWQWKNMFWYQGMDGYCEADEYGNSKIKRQMRSCQNRRGVHQI